MSIKCLLVQGEKGSWLTQRLGALLLAAIVIAVPAVQAQTPAAPAAANLLPPEAFYADDDVLSATISPSGNWLAMTVGNQTPRVSLIVFDLQKWAPHKFVAGFNDADIREAHWVNDETLVFSLSDKKRGGSNQRWYPGLFAVSRDGVGLRILVATNGDFVVERQFFSREPLNVHHRLIHVPGMGGDEVVVGETMMDGNDEVTHVNAKTLNVKTGRVTNLSTGVPSGAWRWMFDASGQPRLLVTRAKGRVAYHWRDGSERAWRQLGEFDMFKAEYSPSYIDSTGQLFVTVESGKDGAAQLHRFNFTTGKPDKEPIVSTPGFDFLGRVVSETKGSRALGVRVVTDAESTVWFDKRMAALQQEADKRWPATVNRLDCRRCDEPDMTVIMRSYSDRDPGQIWVHRTGDNSWRKLSDVRGAIDPRRMATTDMVRIKARDGLEFPVWITRPLASAANAKKPLPAVVLVHGGPWVRGRSWEWEEDAQFLASRGYVVIEPEYRGSTGYGDKLFRAGWRQYGQAMQDDVADALAWAVAQGHVDKNRVCIAGASYGGYATLMGLAKHPELYRCGVAWVAVTDPRLMYTWRYGTDQSDEVREVSYPTLIGDPIKDAAMLDSVTPVLLANKIKAPVMLTMGAGDRRVLLVHGTRMRDALKDAGNPPEWHVYSDEGHGWYLLENRVDFARRMETFLAKHLK
jgi:dipeptidyl aminopeptidase/acylaminoacyl peptidase